MKLVWGPFESIATAAVPLLTALGFGMKAARDKGRLEEKVSQTEKKLLSHDAIITSHTAALAAHEGSFKVIDTKLENIEKSQAREEIAVGKLSDKLDACFPPGGSHA